MRGAGMVALLLLLVPVLVLALTAALALAIVATAHALLSAAVRRVQRIFRRGRDAEGRENVRVIRPGSGST